MSVKTDYFNAISNGNYENVTYFIERGIDINLKDEYGETAIKKAIKNGYKGIVKLLLQKGANIKNEKDLIFIAAEKGYIDIVISLLKYENDSKKRKKALDLAQKIFAHKQLILAIQEQNLNKVKRALQNGADINKPDLFSWTPLMNAIIKKDLQITQYLLKNGANTDSKDLNGETPLFKAIEKNDNKICEELIKFGAKVNIKNNEGNTPLMIAVKNGNFETVKLLTKNNADINILNRQNKNALYLAIENNYEKIAVFLLKKGINKLNYLETALKNDNFQLLERLLEFEKDKIKKEKYKKILENLPLKTKLEIKIKRNEYDEFKNLLKGRTCKQIDRLLYLSIKLSRYNIARFLILNGANTNYYHDNVSLLSIASSLGDLEMVKLLVKYGADINGKGNFILGFPINIAINEGHPDIVKYLVNKGADINKSYGFNLSAKEEAMMSKNQEIKDFFSNL